MHEKHQQEVKHVIPFVRSFTDCATGLTESFFLKFQFVLGCVPTNDANGQVLSNDETFEGEHFWYKCSVTGNMASYQITGKEFLQ